MKTLYTLNLYATALNDEDGEPAWKWRELEKHLLQVLRRAEVECDLEVLDEEQIEE